MRRRGLLGALAAAAGASLLPKRAPAAPGKIRPPMAQPPGAFERACIGCFRCAEVCPPLAIRFHGALSLDGPTPYLDLRESACILCMKCTQACPTDALAPLAADPQQVFEQVRMGAPVLERKKCLPWTGRGVCRICYYACPYPDRAVELVGPQQAPLFHAQACVGCGLCEEACPDEARAVRVVPLEPAAPGGRR